MKKLKKHLLFVLLLTVACSGQKPTEPAEREDSTEPTGLSIDPITLPVETSLPAIGSAEPVSALESDNIEYVGVFSFTKGQTAFDSGEYPLSASARFLKLNTKSNIDAITTSFLSLESNCTVIKNEQMIAGQTSSLDFNYVSVGEVVTLQSDTTSYPDLINQGGSYTVPSGLIALDVFPNELLLNAPGDEFPQIVNFNADLGNGIIGISVGRNGDVFNLGPRRPLVFHKDVRTGWRGGENPNSYIKIKLYSGANNSATCYAPDDTGQWEFPADIQLLMEESYMDLEIARVQLSSTVASDTYILSITEDPRPLY